MIKVNIQLKDTDAIIEDKMINAFRLHLNSVFSRAAHAIRRRIGHVCQELIKNTLEYQSLLSGELLGELGVPEVESKLSAILKIIEQNIEVQSIPINKIGSRLEGGLIFSMIRSSFEDILSLAEANYQTERDTNIPWLDWLILQGDRIIVIGYDVKLDLSAQEKYKSRTGLALMTKGSGWCVPREFSGTSENNFLLRAFDSSQVESILSRIMQEEISSRLGGR